MSRSEYEALALRLRIVRNGIDNHTTEPTNEVRLAVWRECVMAVVIACEALNPNFNRGKFIAACGVPNILGK